MIEYKVWYNYFLFKLGIRKVLPSKFINKIKINENHEALVLVDNNRFIFADIIEKPVYLRKTVYEKLCKLDEMIKEDGYKIKLYDAYRSLDKQKEFWKETLEETKKANPNLSDEEIQRMASIKIANPTNGIGGHQTGGAIDITLVDREGTELDMGSAYLEHIPQTKSYSKDLTMVQNGNRSYLHEKMNSLDFNNFPAEWWHFSYGDRMWAAYKGKKECFYGYAKAPKSNE